MKKKVFALLISAFLFPETVNGMFKRASSVKMTDSDKKNEGRSASTFTQSAHRATSSYSATKEANLTARQNKHFMSENPPSLVSAGSHSSCASGDATHSSECTTQNGASDHSGSGTPCSLGSTQDRSLSSPSFSSMPESEAPSDSSATARASPTAALRDQFLRAIEERMRNISPVPGKPLLEKRIDYAYNPLLRRSEFICFGYKENFLRLFYAIDKELIKINSLIPSPRGTFGRAVLPKAGQFFQTKHDQDLYEEFRYECWQDFSALDNPVRLKGAHSTLGFPAPRNKSYLSIRIFVKQYRVQCAQGNDGDLYSFIKPLQRNYQSPQQVYVALHALDTNLIPLTKFLRSFAKITYCNSAVFYVLSDILYPNLPINRYNYNFYTFKGMDGQSWSRFAQFDENRDQASMEQALNASESLNAHRTEDAHTRSSHAETGEAHQAQGLARTMRFSTRTIALGNRNLSTLSEQDADHHSIIDEGDEESAR